MPLQPEKFLITPPSMAPPVHSREETELDLAAEVLRRFGEVRLVARGSSMIPSIYPGDLLSIRFEQSADIQCGDVVLCLREGRFWIHRVARKWREGGRRVFATQGEALPNEDPPVDEKQLLGRVDSITRHGKPVEFARTHGLWTKLLQRSVQSSDVAASGLLHWHSLRTRIIGNSTPAIKKTPEKFMECV